jgi:glycosyltransferase involved in cell wall biosynthesis
MTDVWRRFASEPGVSLKLYLDLKPQTETAYSVDPLLHGLDCSLHSSSEAHNRKGLIEAAAFDPDLLVILGWRSKVSRALAEAPALARVPKLLAFDMPFALTARKLAAPYVLRNYLRRFAGAFVTGERAAEYARHLGFEDAAIEPGLFGLNTQPFLAARLVRPDSSRYPHKFLYVGRYSRDKRIDLLATAYRLYRESVAEPWGLSCYGMGPDARLLVGQEGIVDYGFAQPADLPAVFASHGAFVIASDYDPWPMVVAQACASAMPIVCTTACGNSSEVVRSYWSGRVCGSGSAASLAEGLRWIHDRSANLEVMGSHGHQLVEAYSDSAWATRFREICNRFARRS